MRDYEFYGLLSQISYKPGYELQDKIVGTGISEVWWKFERPDMVTGDIMTGHSGSVIIYWSQPGVTVETIVRMIFGMTVRLEEHETREFFKFGDQRPFDPHVKLIQ